MPSNNIPFSRDKFIRTLFRDLLDSALEYKARKESTSNENLFIGAPPVMYEYFEEHNFFND